METRLLKLFCAVAECGSLAAASTQLHLTPSALSHGLKALETDVGCRLFERVGKRMLLNQAGEQLLAHIREPLAALDAAAESIKRLGKWGQTRLRLGTAASLCQYFIPGVIRDLRKEFPKLDLRVETGDTAELVEKVRADQVDLAICIEPETAAGLEVRPLFRDELMFVFAPSHPWATGRAIPPAEMRAQPLIIYRRSSRTVGLVDDFFRKLDLTPSTVMEIGSMMAIKELVKLNLGVAILAPWAADKEVAKGTLCMRPLGPARLTRQWVILSLASRRPGLAGEQFCRLCRTHAAGMRLDRRDVPHVRGRMVAGTK
jgi:DNA-binding transcriptional LysR family regulator